MENQKLRKTVNIPKEYYPNILKLRDGLQNILGVKLTIVETINYAVVYCASDKKISLK